MNIKKRRDSNKWRTNIKFRGSSSPSEQHDDANTREHDPIGDERTSKLGAREPHVRSDALARLPRHDQGLLERLPRLAMRAARRAKTLLAATDSRRSDRVRAQDALAPLPLVRAAQGLASAHQAHHDVSWSAHTHRGHR